MMKRMSLGVLCMLLMAPAAHAQYSASRTSTPATGHRAELIPLGGYAWTLAMDVYVTGYNSAQLDFSDTGYYGAALDFNVSHAGSYKTAQARLLYRRSDGQLQFKSGGLNVYNQSIDASIEYWQIGGLGGVQRGNAMPYTCITLGGTRLAANGSDQWKFSMIFGLGVKVYTSNRIGIMIQGNWPITFTDTWGGAYIGTGGASLGISGTGISQLDIGGGLIINL